jgi:hypothetical protein
MGMGMGRRADETAIKIDNRHEVGVLSSLADEGFRNKETLQKMRK